MSDYYGTLGIPKTATPDEIKTAYRRLASKNHPDKGGDTATFQNIQVAYDTLSDPGRRAAYDNPRQQHIPPGFGNAGQFDFDSIFTMFGQRPQQQRTRQDRMALWITLADVATAGRKTVGVGTNNGTATLEIEIPPGINDGDNVHYAKLSPSGGDLVITFRIHPHPAWQRQGLTLSTTHTIGIWQLIAGCETIVSDILGNQLKLTIPAGTQPGTIMKLKSRGLTQRDGPPGDLLVQIQTSIPADIPNELLDLIKKQIDDYA